MRVVVSSVGAQGSLVDLQLLDVLVSTVTHDLWIGLNEIGVGGLLELIATLVLAFVLY